MLTKLWIIFGIFVATRIWKYLDKRAEETCNKMHDDYMKDKIINMTEKRLEASYSSLRREELNNEKQQINNRKKLLEDIKKLR